MLNVPVVAYIGVGANLGDALETVRRAIADISELPAVQILSVSSLYRSAPVDASGPDYVNAVLAADTTLSAWDLLAKLQTLEQSAGRERPYRNAPRTLDLDLLLYGDAEIRTPELTVPHPRMWERAFVVMPLQEIARQRVTQSVLDGVQTQRIHRIPAV